MLIANMLLPQPIRIIFGPADTPIATAFFFFILDLKSWILRGYNEIVTAHSEMMLLVTLGGCPLGYNPLVSFKQDLDQWIYSSIQHLKEVKVNWRTVDCSFYLLQKSSKWWLAVEVHSILVYRPSF